VQAILAARIDRLAPAAKRLLQAAAVVGQDVSLPVLLSIAEIPEEAVRAGLGRLQAAEVLYETRLFPDLEYMFKHALTHEVAYATLLAERRRALHRRVVEIIEAGFADRLAEHLEQLAHHSLRAEAWDKAIPYLGGAGTRAYERSAYRAAAAFFEDAASALAHLPQTRAAIEQAIDLRFKARRALTPLSEWPRVLGHLRAAETLAVAIGDRQRLGRVAAYLSCHFWTTGDLDRARESGERALAMAGN